MNNNISNTIFQNRPIVLPLPHRAIHKNFYEKPSTPQNSKKLPLIYNCPEEQTKIRRILYHRPDISAKSWIAFDCISGQQVDGSNEDEQREIASLTKIITCLVCIQEVFRLKKSFDELVQVSQDAANIDGTRAGLNKGESLKIWDMLHALMLPSGNDAAISLAEHFGRMVNADNPIGGFTGKMNGLCKSLKLSDTVFRNPHGMSTSLNYSSARSVAIIAIYAMKIPVFSKIVCTWSHSCNVLCPDGIRKTTWINTNRLLRKGFSGIKTGYTPAAGPCLCSYVDHRNRKFLIVMLSSKSMQSRWSEASKLWKWANAHILN